MNYSGASDIARDDMPEPVVINLDSDDDDSMSDTASENMMIFVSLHNNIIR